MALPTPAARNFQRCHPPAPTIPERWGRDSKEGFPISCKSPAGSRETVQEYPVAGLAGNVTVNISPRPSRRSLPASRSSISSRDPRATPEMDNIRKKAPNAAIGKTLMSEKDERVAVDRKGVFMAVSPASLRIGSVVVQKPETLFLIAGNGSYPRLAAVGARESGVSRVVAAAFEGETDPVIASYVDETHWMRVGQLGRLLTAAKKSGASASMMAGQIAPGNLFDLRPDFQALFLLAKLRERNAETLFGAIAGELETAGVPLLPATTFLEKHLAGEELVAGPAPSTRLLDDIAFGSGIAKEISRLDIGQTVVVKKGTVLAVEGFDGTDATIRRGGELGKGDSVVVKVSKPSQDMRFDVPVVGPCTLETAASSGISAIAMEAGRTLLIEVERLRYLAAQHKITLWGIPS